jgi:WD40 repeat protein
VFIYLVQAGTSCQWVNDSQRLLLEHFDEIHNSPSQIYHSALPFSPPSSWLHKCYAAELSGEVKAVRGLPAEWGACSRTAELKSRPLALACWKDTIAVGLESNDIIILNKITGSQVAVLSGVRSPAFLSDWTPPPPGSGDKGLFGHTNEVASLAFSPDGTSLFSGSVDKTLKLWDIQTGGVVKTFHGHTGWVKSISTSSDYTTVASGSSDETIRLWDIQTGECCCVIKQQGVGPSVVFSPTDPQHLISTSGIAVQKWAIDGHPIGPAYGGSYTGFSSNGTHFVSCWEGVATVQNSNSGAIVAKFPTHNTNYWVNSTSCFSPNGTLIAVSAQATIYIWDIGGSVPLLIETFIGHGGIIASLLFSSPSTLISTSSDKSVKFWQIGGLPTDPVAGDSKSTPSTLVPIQSISLQVEDGIAISSDLNGVVKVWDISTGLCKACFQTPAKGSHSGEARMIDGRLVFVWVDKAIHIWDIDEGKLLQIVEGVNRIVWSCLRISGDGSKVFYMTMNSIRVWSMWTGEAMGEVASRRDLAYLGALNDSKILVHFRYDAPEVWDFSISGSHSVDVSNTSSKRFRLCGIHWSTSGPSGVKDIVTGKVVFWFSGRYAWPDEAKWDGQYMVAGYKSGEVLILDFNHLHLE